jgi:hypothetical protein
LAPGLAAATDLVWLSLISCGLGNEGVSNLVPDCNTSLTRLSLLCSDIQGTVGGENVVALVAHCTNLDKVGFEGLCVEGGIFRPDQRSSLDTLLDRKRLCTEAAALAGSSFPVLFRAMEAAHRNEQGLGVIFVILQNDVEDSCCNANNRAIEE